MFKKAGLKKSQTKWWWLLFTIITKGEIWVLQSAVAWIWRARLQLHAAIVPQGGKMPLLKSVSRVVTQMLQPQTGLGFGVCPTFAEPRLLHFLTDLKQEETLFLLPFTDKHRFIYTSPFIHGATVAHTNDGAACHALKCHLFPRTALPLMSATVSTLSSLSSSMTSTLSGRRGWILCWNSKWVSMPFARFAKIQFSHCYEINKSIFY